VFGLLFHQVRRRWDSCGIDWGVDCGFDGTPVLSAKDAAAPALAHFTSPFTWEG